MSIALAIFVKTPGLSPVKTRLAADVGQELAEEFYIYSLRATKSIAIELKYQIPDLEVYWAIAEEKGMQGDFWKDFSKISQGEGGLGNRLSTVYDELLKKHDSVFFIGSDSPHLDYQELALIISADLKKKFVLGETTDGGFYLFGGQVFIPQSVWSSVKYSVETTFFDLCERLNELGPVHLVNKSFDIDEAEDLLNYTSEEKGFNNLLPEQQEIIEWVKLNFSLSKKGSTF